MLISFKANTVITLYRDKTKLHSPRLKLGKLLSRKRLKQIELGKEN